MKLQNMKVAYGCLLRGARDASQTQSELASRCKFASGQPGIKPNTQGRPLAKMARHCAQAAAKPPTAKCWKITNPFTVPESATTSIQTCEDEQEMEICVEGKILMMI